MFVVLLEFSNNKSQAVKFMQGHNEWLRQGFDDGVFLLAGGLEPKAGGALVAHNTSRSELELRVNADPFVVQGVVSAKVLEITPARADARLGFLAAP